MTDLAKFPGAQRAVWSSVQGPDGALYLATDADPGAILRVAPPAA